MMLTGIPGTVVVEPLEDTTRTESGLYLPTAEYSRGRALHDATTERGYPACKKNEVVCYSSKEGVTFNHGGKKYIIVRVYSILAIERGGE